jgi:hypothetical protein
VTALYVLSIGVFACDGIILPLHEFYNNVLVARQDDGEVSEDAAEDEEEVCLLLVLE